MDKESLKRENDKTRKQIKLGFFVFSFFGFFIFLILFFQKSVKSDVYISDEVFGEISISSGSDSAHLNNFLPKTKPREIEVKGLYLTAHTAADPEKLADIVATVKSAGLNALVIDIKDYTGFIYYETKVDVINKLGISKKVYDNLPELIKKLHQEGIYVIARQTVFQDPILATKKPEWAIKDNVTGGVWRDYKGLSWVDPTLEEVWDYNIVLAKDAAQQGFDEINFDYIRFPSDGAIKRMQFKNWDGDFPKSDMITGFFGKLSNELKDAPVYLSADLFGLTTVRKDDMNIGQLLEGAAPFFDYICPMMYPSHYPTNYLGFKNPADHPYDIIKQGLDVAVERLKAVPANRAKIRPWIQDFDIGAVYTNENVTAQIRAIEDGRGYGYLSWNARNVYDGNDYIVLK